MDCLDAVLEYEGRSAEMQRAVRRVLAIARQAQLETELLSRLNARDDAVACWIKAALLEEREAWTEAAALYEKVVDPAGREVPEAVLQRARITARTGDHSQALSLLRLAFGMQLNYATILRSEGLVRRLKAHVTAVRTVKVALAGTATTSLLKAVMESLLFRDGIEAAFYEAPFNGFERQILDSNSDLYRFAPEFVVLLLNWRDCGLNFVAEDPTRAVEECVKRFTTLWTKLLEQCPCRIIQPDFRLPTEDPYLSLAVRLSGGRGRVLRRINERLLEQAPPAVCLLDSARVADQHTGRWEDKQKWSDAKLYPAPEALPVLAEHIISSMRAALGLSSKALALDLDNTLWGGVIGEDGLGGITLGPPSALGERFQDLQRYLLGLKERGVLLAAVSKNNPADAESVFRRHDACLLKLDDFVAFQANWEPKHENLLKISSALSLPLDSFVFLDDSPSERANIRKSLPEVIVPEICGEPEDSITALERGLYFQALSLTHEDRSRTGSYLARAYVQQSIAAENSHDYLLGLNMEVDWGAVDESTCARVTQLVNKTNQFNLTTRRYTESQVAEFARSPKHWFRWFRLRDRFADHGLIAVLLAEKLDSVAWNVDSWLMSCRVIGRGLEEFMFNRLIEAAVLEEVQTMLAEYIPTPKNGIMKDVLPHLGFTPDSSDFRYKLWVPSAKLFSCAALTDATLECFV